MNIHILGKYSSKIKAEADLPFFPLWEGTKKEARTES